MKKLLLVLVVLLAGCKPESKMIVVEGTVITISPAWTGCGDGNITVFTDVTDPKIKAGLVISVRGVNHKEPPTRMELVDTIGAALYHRVRVTGINRYDYVEALLIQQLPD